MIRRMSKKRSGVWSKACLTSRLASGGTKIGFALWIKVLEIGLTLESLAHLRILGGAILGKISVFAR